MKAVIRILTITFISSFVSSQVYADTEALEKRLNALEQEVASLKRQLEIEKEEKAKKVPETAVITANSKDGFSIKSPDESFKLRVRGLIQADGRFFTDNQKDNSTTDTFTVRRARPIFEGTVGKSFDFYLVPDFGSGASTLVDAYGDFKFSPIATLRGGKFKAPVGLERLQSDAVANFTEIGLPSNLLPNREVGFQLFGDIFGDTTTYAAGVFNGTADLASSTGQDVDNNSDKDVAGRVFVQPFKNIGPESLKGLGVGVGGSYGHKEGSTIPTYKSAGQSNVFSYSSGTSADGDHVRVTPQASFYKGSLGILGEYAVSRQDLNRGATNKETFTNKAWQVSANYVLTGELASYKGIAPLTNFDLKKKTWGALELVSRVGHLNVDNRIFESGFASPTASVSQIDEWGVGLKWYPSKNYRISLDYLQSDFVGGAALGLDRKMENAILTRFQVAY